MMDGGSMASVTDLMENFRDASRNLFDAFRPMVGVIPSDDLREEIDGQMGRLRGWLDLHAGKAG